MAIKRVNDDNNNNNKNHNEIQGEEMKILHSSSSSQMTCELNREQIKLLDWEKCTRYANCESALPCHQRERVKNWFPLGRLLTDFIYQFNRLAVLFIYLFLCNDFFWLLLSFACSFFCMNTFSAGSNWSLSARLHLTTIAFTHSISTMLMLMLFRPILWDFILIKWRSRNKNILAQTHTP